MYHLCFITLFWLYVSVFFYSGMGSLEKEIAWIVVTIVNPNQTSNLTTSKRAIFNRVLGSKSSIITDRNNWITVYANCPNLHQPVYKYIV